jgi:hypothetical protein
MGENVRELRLLTEITGEWKYKTTKWTKKRGKTASIEVV